MVSFILYLGDTYLLETKEKEEKSNDELGVSRINGRGP